MMMVSACSSSDSGDATVATPADGADAPQVTAPFSDPAEQAPVATDGAQPADTTPPAAAVPQALQFSAPLVGGGTFEGAAVADKPTVFWFWAPT